ncbi:MAG: NAD(P)-dependent oxidoreductase [Proteobacteria bacterium]|nr:NAD(P)-dependent oxidoreductase [Pseudomonadota bacterium]
MTTTPTTPLDPRTILLIGFGEAGTALGEGLADTSGWRRGGPGRTVVAFDIAAGIGPRGEAMARRAKDMGIPLHRQPGDYVREADLVFSAVTGSEAKVAARSVKGLLRPGTTYLDINTVTRRTARELAEEMTAAGLDYVDIAVTGVFLLLRYRVPMLLAGPGAARAQAWMAPLGFEARNFSTRAGDASAVKMLRSIVMKGLEAISVECLVAAHRQGLVKELLEAFPDMAKFPFPEVLARLIRTHVVHAKRRFEEVEKVNENLIETGVPPIMAAAILKNHRRTLDANIAPADGKVPSLEEAIRLFDEKVIGRSAG